MSLKDFSLLEAVELAINMEEEGVRFYTLAMERMEDVGMKKTFELLREKEYTHINTFRKLYTDLAAREGDPDAGLYLTDPDIAAYFRAYVESTVFPVKGAADKVFATLAGIPDVLRLGLQVEKDSILYYQDLARYTRYPEAAGALGRIVAEERLHFQYIYDLWRKVATEQKLGEPFAGRKQ